MPASSVAVRSLALALMGFGGASALAQTANVSAFNPYNGIGLPGSPAPAIPLQAGPMGVPAQPGMAFNPWRPAGVAAGWGAAPPTPPAYASYQGGYQGGYDRGSYLPAPPPGPLESRIVAIPERGERAGARRAPASITPTPAVPPQTQAAVTPPPPSAAATGRMPQLVVPAEPPAAAMPAAPAPVPVQRPPAQTAAPTPAPTPAPPPAPTPAPSAPPAQTAAVAPPPTPPAPPAVRPPPPAGAPMATVQFGRESAEISGEARSELDRVAKSLGSTRQIEVRAYATGPDPADARKIALARALAVRSYLIDQGVKARIEVGAFASETRGPGSERVDVLTPGG